MNSEDKAHAQALVRRLLGEARDHASSGAFQEALAAIRKARGLEPSNVFILAFERQIESIADDGCREALLRFWYLAHACRKG